MLVFHPIIAPYRIDFFNSLAEEYDARICLTWRNLHDQTFDYAKIEEQFRFVPVYLDSRVLKVIPRGIFRQIREFRPDIVLVPECGLISLLVLLFRPLYRFAVRLSGQFCGDSNKEHNEAIRLLRQPRGGYKVVSIIDDSREMLLGDQFSRRHALAEKLLIPHFDDLINDDSRATALFRERYGKGIWFPIIYDEKPMRERYRRVLPLSGALAEKYGLVGKRVVLFVGRMVGLKNVPALIAAFRKIGGDDCALVLVGSGECLDGWRRDASDDSRIIFPGRFEGDELFAWYNIAGVFVLPSVREPFGAVTSEALLGGCLCLVSEKAGSSCLIESGRNGFAFSPDDPDELRRLLEETLRTVPPVSLPLTLRSSRMTLTYGTEISRLVRCLG